MLSALLIAACAHESAAEPVNPFARPFLDTPAGPAATELAASGRPELRGVIVAGAGSVANLSGTLLALGEAASGYQLESVSEYSATFLHDGEPITLYLKDEQPEVLE
ncbi:MAG: hypothetical protein OES38_08580 [Gammaproteobacteria bacterium]|nr:hypothetical protein [Gammaproteobacteria bacterium]